MVSGFSLSELLTWEPRDIATLYLFLDEDADARRDAAKRG